MRAVTLSTLDVQAAEPATQARDCGSRSCSPIVLHTVNVLSVLLDIALRLVRAKPRERWHRWCLCTGNALHVNSVVPRGSHSRTSLHPVSAELVSLTRSGLGISLVSGPHGRVTTSV